jgi:cellulose synthase/poly-beta-1,6-N-acetylglucosamine synthase-like glycosyltransferase
MWLDTVAFAVCCVLLVFILLQTATTIRFTQLLVRYRPAACRDADLPRVAVVMGLRGADPFLAESLSRIFQQDYPDYEVFIVVDSQQDPAWDVVQRAIGRAGGRRVHVEVDRHEAEDGLVNCNNSKIVQAVRGLDSSFDVWAMADGDLLPHSTWLRELVTPLVTDQRVGATYGNRWFVPLDGRWGSLVRYQWNAAALVGMHFLNMPWGGCYAIHASAVRSGKLIDRWARVVSHDSCAPSDLRRQNLSVRFVPSLIMTNEEGCNLGFALNFIQRQMTWARLYHRTWRHVLLQTVITAGCLGAASLLLLYSMLARMPQLAVLSTTSLLLFLGSRVVLMILLELSVRRVLRPRQSISEWITPARFLQSIVSIPLAQIVHVVAAFRATYARRVTWRGITLEIHGPHDIRTASATQACETVSAWGSNTSL